MEDHQTTNKNTISNIYKFLNNNINNYSCIKKENDYIIINTNSQFIDNNIKEKINMNIDDQLDFESRIDRDKEALLPQGDLKKVNYPLNSNQSMNLSPDVIASGTNQTIILDDSDDHILPELSFNEQEASGPPSHLPPPPDFFFEQTIQSNQEINSTNSPHLDSFTENSLSPVQKRKKI